MKYHIAASSGAKLDIRSTVLWYERIDPNLALRFLLETDATVDRVRQNPYRFPVIKGAVRRARLKRFPYRIYYSVDNDEISIIAVRHQRRDDSVWVDRTNGRR
jgi:toxin ParE1/3/4